eukprot:3267106-Lingulodinium_polyedra.AAC.2
MGAAGFGTTLSRTCCLTSAHTLSGNAWPRQRAIMKFTTSARHAASPGIANASRAEGPMRQSDFLVMPEPKISRPRVCKLLLRIARSPVHRNPLRSMNSVTRRTSMTWPNRA